MLDYLWWVRPQRTRTEHIRDTLSYFWEEHAKPVLLLLLFGATLGVWVELVLRPALRDWLLR